MSSWQVGVVVVIVPVRVVVATVSAILHLHILSTQYLWPLFCKEYVHKHQMCRMGMVELTRDLNYTWRSGPEYSLPSESVYVPIWGKELDRITLEISSNSNSEYWEGPFTIYFFQVAEENKNNKGPICELLNITLLGNFFHFFIY